MERLGESFAEPIGEPKEETEEIKLIIGNKKKLVKLGKGLETGIREKLVSLLLEFSDVFAWSPKDMPGVPKSISVHRLNVNKEKKSVRQKKKNHALERQKAIDEEVEKLLTMRFIFEIEYPEWLANVVLAKKLNEKNGEYVLTTQT